MNNTLLGKNKLNSESSSSILKLLRDILVLKSTLLKYVSIMICAYDPLLKWNPPTGSNHQMWYLQPMKYWLICRICLGKNSKLPAAKTKQKKKKRLEHIQYKNIIGNDKNGKIRTNPDIPIPVERFWIS